jgi:hypothetical protein
LNWGELTSTPVFWPFLETPEVILIRPLLSGSGKFPTPWLRMHAEYATGSSEPEVFEELEPFAFLFVSTCATLASDESPQAEASRESPTTPAIASARSAARLSRRLPPFIVCALRAQIAISSPSQLAHLRV